MNKNLEKEQKNSFLCYTPKGKSVKIHLPEMGIIFDFLLGISKT